jgi:hypothetical protein
MPADSTSAPEIPIVCATKSKWVHLLAQKPTLTPKTPAWRGFGARCLSAPETPLLALPPVLVEVIGDGGGRVSGRGQPADVVEVAAVVVIGRNRL